MMKMTHHKSGMVSLNGKMTKYGMFTRYADKSYYEVYDDSTGEMLFGTYPLRDCKAYLRRMFEGEKLRCSPENIRKEE